MSISLRIQAESSKSNGSGESRKAGRPEDEDAARNLGVATTRMGMCLCVGCWLEGGDLMGKDVLETIHYFGERNKLFKVHFRNVDAPLPHFVETFMDGGYMDMYKVMKALQEVNFNGVAIPDHIPRMAGGRGVATAYTIGYMKALLQRANEEIDCDRNLTYNR